MRNWLLGIALGVSVAGSAAQTASQPQSGYERAARATVLHTTNVYVGADPQSQRITTMLPGRELIIEQKSGDWLKVFANTDVQEQREEEIPEFTESEETPPKSGWIRNKGVVGPQTPDGDRILYGAAVIAETAASQPHAPKSAAASAYLLYRRAAEYFPQSPLAGEAEWRSADIRWQIEKADNRTLPSAKEMDPNARPPQYDAALKRIVKQRPGTKYAALAAYDLLDAKLCGDWQGLPKCPQMESEVYEKYASQYPDGPKTAEALWNAAYRQGVLVSMYEVDENRKRVEVATKHAHELVDQLKAKFSSSDYAARGDALIYRIEQGIPIYGNDRD
ncbi:MAG: SH3 domain-containing protein [Acidobacteria bacterium]|nr:SH3 domain-containing protein [Acidobacteriota bacterium]